HGDGRGTGADQFERGARPRAHERHSAAVHQLWRIEPARNAAGNRRAVEHQPARGRDVSADAKSLLIAGGGTGGHVFPALAVAKEWLRRGSEGGGERRVMFVGTERGMEARLVPQAGLPVEMIRVAGLKGIGGTKFVRN